MPRILLRARRLFPTPSLVLGVLFLGPVLFANATCLPRDPLIPVVLKAVVDGDTLRLDDGRLLRLVGVNTPELGRDGAEDQPLAKAARDAVARRLQAGQTLYVEPGPDVRDRHGRWLASVFLSPQGEHLGERLLLDGLGWQVAVPPNLRHVECLRAAEARARDARRGVWEEAVYAARPVAVLRPGMGGFMRLYGTVSKVASGRDGWWLELENRLSLRLDRDDLRYFPELSPPALRGSVITVRGWVTDRGEQRRGYPRHLMHLRHAVMLESNVGGE